MVTILSLIITPPLPMAVVTGHKLHPTCGQRSVTVLRFWRIRKVTWRASTWWRRIVVIVRSLPLMVWGVGRRVVPPVPKFTPSVFLSLLSSSFSSFVLVLV